MADELAGSRSNGYTLNGGIMSPDSKSLTPCRDFSSETFDGGRDADDYDGDSYLDSDSPTHQRSTQPSFSVDLFDPVNVMNYALKAAYNSDLVRSATNYAHSFTRKLFPNLYPEAEQKIELAEKKDGKKPIDIELNDEDDPGDESSDNCSCPLGKQNQGEMLVKSRDGEDWMSKFSTEIESVVRTLKKQREEEAEENSESLKEIQDGIDQFRRKLDSDQTEPGPPTEQTDLTFQGQNNLKNEQSRVDNTGVVTEVTVPPGPSLPSVGLQDDSGANSQSALTGNSTVTNQSFVSVQPPITNQLGLRLEIRDDGTLTEDATSGEVGSLVTDLVKSPDVVIQQETATCMPNNPTHLMRSSPNETLQEDVTGLQTTTSVESDRLAAKMQVTNHNDNLVLATVIVAGVLIATEPWWGPKVWLVLNRIFAKPVPNRAASIPFSTVQETPRLYSIPTTRRDNIF